MSSSKQNVQVTSLLLSLLPVQVALREKNGKICFGELASNRISRVRKLEAEKRSRVLSFQLLLLNQCCLELCSSTHAVVTIQLHQRCVLFYATLALGT